MARIIHIVPSMPPEINGLGDYAHQLWRYWPEPRPEWHIAGSRVPEGAQQAWPEVQIHRFQLNEKSLAGVLANVRAEVAILHYVGYAYARRGAPMWMPVALADWKRGTGANLVVMFHELYATGPPWRSEFWMKPLQRRIVTQLLGLADRWICSCRRQRQILVEELRADPSLGALIPIGSNIDPIRSPEWARPWPLSIGKKLRIVAFGQGITRLRSLRAHQNLLRELCRRDLVESVLLLGKSEGAGPVNSEIDRLVKKIGCGALCQESYDVSSAAISEQLLDRHLGLLSNPYGILTKSGVFAAYCSHGVISLIPGSGYASNDPFISNFDSRPNECAQALTGPEARRSLEATRDFSSGLSWRSIASAWKAHMPARPSE